MKVNLTAGTLMSYLGSSRYFYRENLFHIILLHSSDSTVGFGAFVTGYCIGYLVIFRRTSPGSAIRQSSTNSSVVIGIFVSLRSEPVIGNN